MLPIEEFNAKVHRIAIALFYTILKDDEESKYEHRADLRNKKGDEGLRIVNGSYASRNRLVIRGHYPADYKGRYHLSGGDGAPQITIDETKSAEEIVNDITRRFLPGYKETLALVLERNAQWKAEEESKEKALRLLAKALGVRDIRAGGQEWVVYFHKGNAKVYTGGDVELKIYLPLDAALKVASLVGKLRGK